jgi:uncharacterized protein
MKCLPILITLATMCACIPNSFAENPKKVLVVTTTTGYRHSSIPTAEKVLAQLAGQSGKFTVEFLRQPAGKADDEGWQDKLKQALEKLSPESLKNYDGVIFANTTGDLPIPDKAGFLDWLRSGKAFIGMHSASDTFHGWPEFIEMIGGQFESHGPQVGVECLNLDEHHPATAHLGKSWSIPQEEIYLFKNYNADRVKDLLALDKHPNNKTPGHFPIAWHREFGKGKVFYTALGHREDIWDADPNLRDRKNPVEVSQRYQAHILGGIEWALGLRSVGAPQ